MCGVFCFVNRVDIDYDWGFMSIRPKWIIYLSHSKPSLSFVLFIKAIIPNCMVVIVYTHIVT